MSNLHTITAIVPRLPPAIDGVGDYTLNLARQLRKDFNMDYSGGKVYIPRVILLPCFMNFTPLDHPGQVLFGCHLYKNS